MRKIERGEGSSLRRKTLASLERALEWPDGLTDKILNGTATEDELKVRFRRIEVHDSGTFADDVAVDRRSGSGTARLGLSASGVGGRVHTTMPPAEAVLDAQVHERSGGAAARGASSGQFTIAPSGIASAEAVGRPTITGGQPSTADAVRTLSEAIGLIGSLDLQTARPREILALINRALQLLLEEEQAGQAAATSRDND